MNSGSTVDRDARGRGSRRRPIGSTRNTALCAVAGAAGHEDRGGEVRGRRRATFSPSIRHRRPRASPMVVGDVAAATRRPAPTSAAVSTVVAGDHRRAAVRRAARPCRTRRPASRRARASRGAGPARRRARPARAAARPRRCRSRRRRSARAGTMPSRSALASSAHTSSANQSGSASISRRRSGGSLLGRGCGRPARVIACCSSLR